MRRIPSRSALSFLTNWLLLAALVGLVVAGLALIGGPVRAQTIPVPAGGCPQPAGSFEVWLSEFGRTAVRAGIRQETVARAFDGVRRDPSVGRADGAQPEFERRIWDYLDRAVSDGRISRGRELRRRHAPILEKVEAVFGVQPEYIVAIWGLESAFGQVTGGHNVLQALANLGYAGRRADFACRELLQSLHLIETTGMAPDRFTGSWAGASGQPQFLPSSILRYGVDFNLDGRVDVWNTLPDIFASIASHLSAAGWRAAVPWGQEVVLPVGFEWASAALGTVRPVGAWRAAGVRAVSGRRLPADDLEAAILLRGGHTGPAFLVSENFRAILGYNFSTSYALAVGLLADRIAGRPGVQQSWPVTERPLGRAEREALQQALLDRSYPVGGVDGVIGRQTRGAIRAFQLDIGVPADGFASAGLLARLLAP